MDGTLVAGGSRGTVPGGARSRAVPLGPLAHERRARPRGGRCSAGQPGRGPARSTVGVGTATRLLAERWATATADCTFRTPGESGVRLRCHPDLRSSSQPLPCDSDGGAGAIGV
ncbi:DUF6207 family protein [Streptomyces sp. NPDC086787]|uniref:DUF6207 family protein n=1 Tax=Streptomyces sp. NPDC086787 TaxID=3365759 RepID=UPI003826315F